MSSASLLIELGCEELPAAACRAADAQAGDVVARLLRERRLASTAVEVLVSPRRIAVLAHGVPDRQVAERVEHRGPPERVARDGDGWTRAAVGFARRHGLGPEALELRDGFTWVSLDATTATLDVVVGEVVDGLIEGLQLPKNMRWGSETLRFARPIRTLAVLHGERVLDASVAGVSSCRSVRGHRLVAPTVDLEAAERYVARMREPGALSSALAWYRALPFGARDRVGTVTVPTLHVWSTGDAFLGPAATARTRTHVTGPYRLEVLEGVPHWIPEVAAERTAELVVAHTRTAV